jgi:predicted glycosyltransferase
MRTLVYALGGGAGHLTRALVFARSLVARGPVVVVARAGSPVLVDVSEGVAIERVNDATPFADVRAGLASALTSDGPCALVVDTFPGGLGGELDDAVLALAATTTLVARYVKRDAYPDYDDLAARFDAIVEPYARGASEWIDEDPPGLRADARAIGVLARPLAIAEGAPAPIAVLGPIDTLTPAMRARLPRGTRFVDAPLAELPAARAYLATGAGYHASYELARAGRPFGLVPRERRFDDQFRRAALLERAVVTADDVSRLLEEAA